MTVVSFVPNNALCNDSSALADRIRSVAARIESGEWAGLDRLIIVFDGAEVDWACYGISTNRAEVVGLLEYAKQKVMG